MAYTFWVQHRFTGKSYYGCRKQGDPAELWQTFFTTNRTIWDDIEKDGLEAFVVQVDKVYSDPLQALKREDDTLKKIPDDKKHMWYNTEFGNPEFDNYYKTVRRRVSRVENLQKGRGMRASDYWKHGLEKMHEANKGKKRSEDTKKKIAESMKQYRANQTPEQRARPELNKPVKIEGITYESIKEALWHENLTRPTLLRRIKDPTYDYEYVDSN